MFGNQASRVFREPGEVVDLMKFLKPAAPVPAKKCLDEIEFFSPYRKDGIKKSTPADPIRSYDEFVAVSRYFEERGMWRDKALWWCGIALGLRCSDLTALRWGNIIDADGVFLQRTRLYEKKTGKLKDLLLTEAVQLALAEYINHLPEYPRLPDYVFAPKTVGRGGGENALSTTQVYKILTQAGKAAGVQFHMSTHTMRKSFINIMQCVHSGEINPLRIEMCRLALNHSSSLTTMKYLNVEREFLDQGRRAVSDFLLGKTEKKELILDERTEQSEQIMEMLEEVLSMLSQDQNVSKGENEDSSM